jgi:hypothetical protein
MGRPKDAPNKNKRGMAARLKEDYVEEKGEEILDDIIDLFSDDDDDDDDDEEK